MAKNYCEQHNSGWRFIKRLNPSKGQFYGLDCPTVLKRPIAASNESQAIDACQEIARKLKVLQLVSKGDRTTTFSRIQYAEAIESFLWFHDFDPRTYIERMGSNSVSNRTITHISKIGFVDQVKDFYQVRCIDGLTAYTSFGALLVKAIESNELPTPSLSDALNGYLGKSRGSKQDWTEKSKQDTIRYVGLFDSTVGTRPFTSIQRSDVQTHINERLLTVKPQSVQRELRSLSALWNYCALANDFEGRNPFSRPTLPSFKPSSRKAASLEASKTLYKALITSRQSYVHHLTLLLLLTGARLAEIWGIQPSDIDTPKSIFWIKPNELRRTKNNQSVRPLPLTPTIRSVLTDYLTTDRPNSAGSASASVGKFLRSRGFQFSAHGLRHGARDRFDELSARATDIEFLLGWSLAKGGMFNIYGSGELTEVHKLLM
ncbi:MAG: tyrosine-type recombinase/integrase [Limnohabitans sp.]